MIKFKRQEPAHHFLPCGARRTRYGTVTCEKPALHAYGCVGIGRATQSEHAGRGRTGQWFFWTGARRWVKPLGR